MIFANGLSQRLFPARAVDRWRRVVGGEVVSMLPFEPVRRTDIVRRRQRWRSLQSDLDPQCLVFIDEIWIKTNMAPLRGWGLNGKRLRGFALHVHRRTLTNLRERT